LVIVKSGRLVHESSDHGIRSLVEAIERNEDTLSGASMADSIVGKAAALLSMHAGISAIYAVMLSEKGRDVLSDNGIQLEYESLVPRILNRKGDDFCPYEKVVLDIDNPAAAFQKLRNFKPY
jgi:hypothetical protein